MRSVSSQHFRPLKKNRQITSLMKLYAVGKYFLCPVADAPHRRRLTEASGLLAAKTQRSQKCLNFSVANHRIPRAFCLLCFPTVNPSEQTFNLVRKMRGRGKMGRGVFKKKMEILIISLHNEIRFIMIIYFWQQNGFTTQRYVGKDETTVEQSSLSIV